MTYLQHILIRSWIPGKNHVIRTPPYEGAVAEWLGSGLQIPLCRFDSGPYLQKLPLLNLFLSGLCDLAAHVA